MKNSYQKTLYASFTGCIVQAIVINFAPLLFLTFESSYNIPISQITLLIMINFAIQLMMDLFSAPFIDKIGYRAAIVMAHVCAATGLLGLVFLPEWMPHPFHGLLVAVIIYALGGGLIEVLISPIVESCPTENKEKTMSLLHSFYSWGQMGVVLLSTLFFKLVGIENWKIMACIWAIIPLVNAFVFTKVPILSPCDEGTASSSIVSLLKDKTFLLFMLMMICAGASEASVSQWASTFAEKELGVSKTVGDLAGPMAFAFLMGSVRLFYGKSGDKINLDRFILSSAVLCVISYLCISLSPWPPLALIGCALCGLSVAIMWPGTLSKAAALYKTGGTAMFALLALAGDVGCISGPALAGFVSDIASNNLKYGLLAAVVFPVLLIFGILLVKPKKR
ncbi:MAG: MFS transporter [Clostridiales bacterium]|nr:MFS transporter [Clostridiales bacterium]